MHLCEIATLRHQFDIVFIVVKAYDTRWVTQLIKPYVKAEGLVIGLQNGMTIDDVAPIMGVERTIGAVIEIAAAMWSPGIVERHTPPEGTWFALGSLSEGISDRLPAVSEILSCAGTAEIVSDIRSAKWMKLVVNAAELVPSAICNLPLLEAAQIPGMDPFMRTAGKEAIRTAVDSGQRVVPIFGLTDVDPDDPDGLVDRLLDAVYTQWSLPQTKTTVLQDWQKGRRAEAEQLNGYVVQVRSDLGRSDLGRSDIGRSDLGRSEIGRDVPANRRVLEIAQRIENGDLLPDPANAELLLAP